MPFITRIKRNDTAPPFSATLLNASGGAVNLVGATARFLMRDPRTRQLKVDAAATIVDAAKGEIRYDWAVGDTNRAAVYQVEIQIEFSDNTVETFPNGSTHRLEVVKDLGPAVGPGGAVPPPAGADGILRLEDIGPSTAGQTEFTLPSVPTNPSAALLLIEGVGYSSPVFFTLAGDKLTWLEVLPLGVLPDGARVEILYH